MEELARHKLDDATAYLYHWVMKNRIQRILINIALISLILLPLAAATDFTATYTPAEYLEFKKGSGAYTSDKFTALLGTLTVTIPNPPISLKEPSLISSGSTWEFSFTGLRNYGGYQQNGTGGFYLDTITTVLSPGQSTYIARIDRQIRQLTTQTQLTNVTGFETKIYFVAYENSASFIPGESYSLATGTVGSFNLAVSPPGKNIDSAQTYVEINGQGSNPQTNPIPILGPAGHEILLEESLPYVDAAHPPVRPSFAISLVKTPSITLSQAYTGGNQPPTVANASVAITNGKPNKTYKVFIKFDSSSVLNSNFRLRLTNFPTVYAIPYTFLFGTDTVTPGIDIPWDGLVINPTGQQNKKTIKVTGIDQTTAEKAVSGGYSDTITVTITASDTV